jgi:hypothetical protein
MPAARAGRCGAWRAAGRNRGSAQLRILAPRAIDGHRAVPRRVRNSCPSHRVIAGHLTVRANPDGKDYIISYNDCCGKTACGHCLCNRNEGDRPVYQPAKSNDINWCHGTKTNIYHCSTSVVLGLAVAD